MYMNMLEKPQSGAKNYFSLPDKVHDALQTFKNIEKLERKSPEQVPDVLLNLAQGGNTARELKIWDLLDETARLIEVGLLGGPGGNPVSASVSYSLKAHWEQTVLLLWISGLEVCQRYNRLVSLVKMASQLADFADTHGMSGLAADCRLTVVAKLIHKQVMDPESCVRISVEMVRTLVIALELSLPSDTTAPTSPELGVGDLSPTIRQVLTTSTDGQAVTLQGWVRSVRKQKARSFIELHDGSTAAGIQVVVNHSISTASDETSGGNRAGKGDPGTAGLSAEVTTGASLRIDGVLAASPGGKQDRELQADQLVVLGTCPTDTYPLQKKFHSTEFLRSIPHLRPRTRTFNNLMRVRDMATHRFNTFLHEQDFVQVHTPILTSHDCEGGGEVFKVVSNPKSDSTTVAPLSGSPSTTVPAEFFGRPTFTTVSAQLHAEVMTQAFNRVYTFNPTFRAEPSMTSRHLAEFWMLEAEMAFLTDLTPLLDFTERMIKDVVGYVRNHADAELSHLEKWGNPAAASNTSGPPTPSRRKSRTASPSAAVTPPMTTTTAPASRPLALRQVWEALLDRPFARMTYTAAVTELQAHAARHPDAFKFPVVWGRDLQIEHELWLAETLCRGPVFVTDYPAALKAFYMKANNYSTRVGTSALEEGRATVASVDLLVPGPGELMGGSLREHNVDVLEQKIQMVGLPLEDYQWYLDLRRYGSVPHGGFGIGFDRFIQMITGMDSIRDVIPFPRYVGHCQL
ncbi:asparaginyl-tRNA synthetase [Dimargaris cristalligena]|nr:asparaginyl-tRNA synthetase [Dimargaris cristalligena]